MTNAVRSLAALAAATFSLTASADPGPEGLFLDIDGAVFIGETLTFTAEGATPGTYAAIVYGGAEETGFACPAAIAPICIDVKNWQLLGQPKRVPASGTVTWNVNVPASLPPGALGYFQVVQNGSAAVAASSQVVAKFNPRPAGGDLGVVLASLYTIGAGASTLSGFDLEEYYVERPVGAGTAYLQWCRIGWDSVGVTPAIDCPSCEWEFDVVSTNPTDASVTGDCLGYLGLDATTVGDKTQGWGWDPDYYFAGYGNYETILGTYDADSDPLTPDVWGWFTRSIVPYPIFYTGSAGSGGDATIVFDYPGFIPAFY